MHFGPSKRAQGKYVNTLEIWVKQLKLIKESDFNFNSPATIMYRVRLVIAISSRQWPMADGPVLLWSDESDATQHLTMFYMPIGSAALSQSAIWGFQGSFIYRTHDIADGRWPMADPPLLWWTECDMILSHVIMSHRVRNVHRNRCLGVARLHNICDGRMRYWIKP